MIYDKNTLREEIKKQRKKLTHEEIEQKSAKISDFVTDSDEYLCARCICVYMASFNEPRTMSIIRQALSDGKLVCIPVSDTTDCTLSLSYISDTTSFVQGAYGIWEPSVIEDACADDVDLILVPGIVFDRHGSRIGFGKGFYDKFLSDSNAVKMGICYAFQIKDEIVPDVHDIPMDLIITEEEKIICR